EACIGGSGGQRVEKCRIAAVCSEDDVLAMIRAACGGARCLGIRHVGRNDLGPHPLGLHRFTGGIHHAEKIHCILLAVSYQLSALSLPMEYFSPFLKLIAEG